MGHASPGQVAVVGHPHQDLEASVEHPYLDLVRLVVVAVHRMAVAYPGPWVALVGDLVPGDLVGEPLVGGLSLLVAPWAEVPRESGRGLADLAPDLPLLEGQVLVGEGPFRAAEDPCSAVDPAQAYPLPEVLALGEEEGPCLVVDHVLVGPLPEDLL